MSQVGRWGQYTVAQLQDAGSLLVEDGNHGEYRPLPHEFSSIGVSFIRATDLGAGCVKFGSASRINDSARARIRKGIGAGGDVILSHKGTVGKIAFAPLDCEPFVCSPQTTFWRSLDQGMIDRRYLYYYLCSDDFRRQLDARKGETDMADYVSLTAQRELRVCLPSIEEQRSIGYILGALDDRIALNQRMNQTLEFMARAIFRSWFVDFDPVVAKAAGRQPFGMSADVAALFPDTLVSDDRGDIPLGWLFRPLVELTTKIGSGATPRGGSAVYVPQGTSFIRSQNVLDHEFGWSGLARITDEAAQQLNGVTVRGGDVLLNITGDSILRTCVVDSAALPARVSQHVAIIRPSPRIPTRYLHLRLVDDEMKDFLIGFDAGGTRPAVTKAQLETVPILVPPDALLARFDELTDPLFRRVDGNRREARTLASLRDTLLPKLMSGDLRVRDAEKLAGTHV